jgi:hypothetical protein
MKFRLDREIPTRVVAAIAYFVFLFLCSLFVYVLVASCRDWVAVFFLKQVARIHYHQAYRDRYEELRPPFEAVQYDPVACRYVVDYGGAGTFGVCEYFVSCTGLSEPTIDGPYHRSWRSVPSMKPPPFLAPSPVRRTQVRSH